MKREEMYNADNETTREEMYKSNVSLPPAEGAEQLIRVRNILQDFYRRGDYELEQAAEDIMRIFTQQPTAEGAEEILLLAKYISQIRVVNDPDIDQLLKLDDLWKEVYVEHRIKIGFSEASLIAYSAVIKKVRALHAQKIADKMVDEMMGERLLDYEIWRNGQGNDAVQMIESYLKSRDNA